MNLCYRQHIFLSRIFPLNSFYPLSLLHPGQYFPCNVFPFQRTYLFRMSPLQSICLLQSIFPADNFYYRFSLTNICQIKNIYPVDCSIFPNILHLQIIFAQSVLSLQSISFAQIFSISSTPPYNNYPFRLFIPNLRLFSSVCIPYNISFSIIYHERVSLKIFFLSLELFYLNVLPFRVFPIQRILIPRIFSWGCPSHYEFTFLHQFKFG